MHHSRIGPLKFYHYHYQLVGKGGMEGARDGYMESHHEQEKEHHEYSAYRQFYQQVM